MLLVERKATIPSENVIEQVRNMVNKHLSKLFKRFGGKKFKELYKLDDKMVDKYDKWLMGHKGYEYLGDITATDLENNQEIEIDVFVISKENFLGYANAAYNREKNQVQVNVDLLKSERRNIINKISHEIIHGIQKFKDTKRYINDSKNDPESNFLYYTELMEFDAQVGELMLNIQEYYKDSDDREKRKILAILKDFLKKNKETIKRIDWTKINTTFKELFYEYNNLIYFISNPPVLDVNDRNLDDSQKAERRYKNEKYQKVSDNRYMQFKQKLFNTYQNLLNKK